jgi:hypothetical protein
MPSTKTRKRKVRTPMNPAKKAHKLLRELTTLLTTHNGSLTLLESDDIVTQDSQATAFAIRKILKLTSDSDKSFNQMILAHRKAEGVFERADILAEVEGAPNVVMTFAERERRSPRWKDIYLNDFEEADRQEEADRVLAETKATVSVSVKLEESA